MSLTYKLDPTAFSTFGSVNLEGAQSFTLNRVGDESLLQSDGKPFVMGSFIDNLSYTVSVELSQNLKTVAVGDVNTLTLRAKERKNGEGVDTGALTFTSAANGAIVTSVDHVVNHSGNSTCTVNFRIVSVDGTTDPLTVA
jgi:hypothetical protein